MQVIIYSIGSPTDQLIQKAGKLFFFLSFQSIGNFINKMVAKPPKSFKKWNESGFRPPLCTYRLNWAKRTSWGWWDDWDDTVLQAQDSKFEPPRSEAEHATPRSRRLPTILTFTLGMGRNIFCFFQTAETGNRTSLQVCNTILCSWHVTYTEIAY